MNSLLTDYEHVSEMAQDYGILSIEDEETLAFVMGQSSAAGVHNELTIDDGDDAALLSALLPVLDVVGWSLDDNCPEEEGCEWDGSQRLIITRSPHLAFELDRLLQKDCKQHWQKNSVVVVTDDAQPFAPFNPYKIVERLVTEDKRAYQIMPSLSALRTLGAIDAQQLFWEQFEGVVMALALS
jgi:hypothetical protein